ncbi:MAG: threonine/serine exporter family protein [Phycicoccus sp.]|nr:threonine/serine exporter family protein [Phycicoccus sp.]
MSEGDLLSEAPEPDDLTAPLDPEVTQPRPRSRATLAGREAWLRVRHMRGEPPTDPIPLVELVQGTPYRHVEIPSEVPDEGDRVLEALRFAGQLGELMLRSGAGAPQVEASMAAVGAASGLPNLEIDITLQSLLLQAHSAEGAPWTQLRVVRATRPDHDRLTAIHQLVAAMVAGDLDLDAAVVELRRIKARSRRWPDRVRTVASALVATAVALMIGAGLFAGLWIFLSVLVVATVHSAVRPLRLPDFYVDAGAAFFATLLAWLGYLLGALEILPISPSDFAFMVAGGIVSLLPGATWASAIEDVLSGYPLTGVGRMFGTSITLLGVILGVGSAVQVTARLTSLSHVTSPTVVDLQPTEASWAWVLSAGLVLGGMAAVTLQSRPRMLGPCALLSVVGVTVVQTLQRTGIAGPIMATAGAAIVVGFLGRFAAERLRAPALVLIVPSTLALLPGLLLFRGIYQMVGVQGAGTLAIESGLIKIVFALATLLAIATGTTFGEILAAPFDRSATLIARRRRRS